MARVKLIYPSKNPIFSTEIPLRITDMNYGNHLGNDAVLSIMHDARDAFFVFNELHRAGNRRMRPYYGRCYDRLQGQGYYGDILKIELFGCEITAHSFDLMYKISTIRNNTYVEIADAKTGMVAFDYGQNKVTQIPGAFRAVIDPRTNAVQANLHTVIFY